MKKQITQITPEELAAETNPAPQTKVIETIVDPKSTKYLNKISFDDLYNFFVPFGIEGPYSVQETRNDKGEIEGYKFFCDDFNATLSSDFNFMFAFFDYSAGDHNSTGKTIKHTEIAELSHLLNLSRNQTMSLLLSGVFMDKFPSYGKEWRHLFDTDQLVAFKQNSLPKAFNNFGNLKTIFDLAKMINSTKSNNAEKQLA